MYCSLIQVLVVSVALLFGSTASAMTCGLSGAAQLVFGRYEPWSESPNDIQGTFYLECTPDFPGEMLNINVRLLPSFPASMTLRNIRTGEWLRYTLYRDPGRTVPIFGDELFDLRTPLAVPTRFPVTLYGRISPGQNVGIGLYRSRLNMLIQY